MSPTWLVEQSELIAIAAVRNENWRQEIILEVRETLKGKLLSQVIRIGMRRSGGMDVIGANSIKRARLDGEKRGQIALVLKGMYNPPYDKVRTSFYLMHVAGGWFKLSKEAGRWTCENAFGLMDMCWWGGTDMLVERIRHIMDAGSDVIIPCETGVQWAAVREAPGNHGRASVMLCVDVKGDRQTCLYIGSDQGDRLFATTDGSEHRLFEITDRIGLKARSRQSCWGDFDGDGQLDLASFDGEALFLYLQKDSGRFERLRAEVTITAFTNCQSLTSISLAPHESTAIVVGSDRPFLLAKDAKDSVWRERFLPTRKHTVTEWGNAQACIVADFDNDGYADVIQPHDGGGLLYAGRGKGKFLPPVNCGIAYKQSVQEAILCDFDCNGWLDILVFGGKYENPSSPPAYLYENQEDGTFRERLWLAGGLFMNLGDRMTCAVGDFNNDGIEDVVSCGIDDDAIGTRMFNFGRGFRSFDDNGDAKIRRGGAEYFFWHDRVALCDLNCDGAQDFVAVKRDGSIVYAANRIDKVKRRCLKVSLEPGLYRVAPITVRAALGKHRMGARVVTAGSHAFFGIPGKGKCRLEWRLPGEPLQEATVKIADGPVQVVLGRSGTIQIHRVWGFKNFWRVILPGF